MEVVEVGNIQDDPAEPVEENQDQENNDHQAGIPEPIALEESINLPNSQANRQIENQ